MSAAPRSWAEKKTAIKSKISETISEATIRRSPLVISVRCDQKGRDQKDLAGPKSVGLGPGEEILSYATCESPVCVFSKLSSFTCFSAVHGNVL